ncbi:MAG: DPP IV N-terminal domain-containing protein, partial [Gemmatimonadetes bacterium]|nr:DPP IV N-terminal domain-containing protein [Gemmatimonadota bacterium]
MRASPWLVPFLLPVLLPAQDRLRTMPRFDRYQQFSRLIPGAMTSGAIVATWDADSRGFRYQHAGKAWQYDLATRRATPSTASSTPNGGRRGGPERGRQYDMALSPDSTRKAFYRDRNLWISDTSGANAIAVTTDGNEGTRIKNGSASWVYGEELGQVTAMWWSPDGKQLAYYRFDESPVKDFYLQMDQTKVQGALDVEAYPKAGTPNPVVELFVYDVASRRTQRIDVRNGQPFTNDVVGHYVYAVGWSPDGRELTFNRTNRRQNVMEFTACAPATGACRVVVREEWPSSWVENHPDIRFLADGRRFLWVSERTGFANIYLYDFATGRQLAAITRHEAEVSQVVRVDEGAGVVWYLARTGDNHMKLQLHRVRLDGTGDVRLTDPAWNHTVAVAPDGRHIVDVAQTHNRPPVTRLLDARGTVLTTVMESSLATYDSLGLRRAELFTYKAADGVTELHGLLHRPSDFDSTRRYPVLVTVYAGPATNGARETFVTPHPLTELGFLVVSLDSRSAGGRGKRFLDAIYLKLGTVEIDDQAAGVRA